MKVWEESFRIVEGYLLEDAQECETGDECKGEDSVFSCNSRRILEGNLDGSTACIYYAFSPTNRVTESCARHIELR